MADAKAKLNVLIAYKAAVSDADKALEWLKKWTIGLTTAGTAMAVLGAKNSVALGTQLTQLAAQANMNLEPFQNLALLAAQNSVDMQMMADSGAELRKVIQEAAAGNAGMVQSLKDLNLTAAGLQALAPERQWEVIAQRVATATDRHAALNAVTKLFGSTNGPKLLTTLETLATDGYDKVAESMGNIRMTDDQINTLNEAGNKLQRIVDYVKFLSAKKFSEALDSPMAAIAANTAQLAAGGLDLDARLALAQDNVKQWQRVNNDVMTARWQQEVKDLQASIESRNTDPRWERQQRLMDETRRRAEAAQQKAMDDATAAAGDPAADARRKKRIEETRKEWEEMEKLRASIVQSIRAQDEEINRWQLSEILRETNVELANLGMKLSRVEASPFLTDVEKRQQRVALLEQENAKLDEQAAALQKLSGLPGIDPVTLNDSIRGLGDRRAQNEFSQEQSQELTVAEARMASIVDLQNQIGTGAEQIGRVYGTVVNSAIDGIAGGIQGLLDGTLSWSDALRNIGSSVVSGIIQAISRMFAEWIVGRALMAAKNVAFSKVEGAADVAAKAPGAALTSISSFGLAAVAGMAAFVAAMALFGGFAEGGYTGAGGRYEVAGAVHRGEVVLEQPIVKGQVPEVLAIRAALQQGVPAATMLGRAGYAEGGMVGGVSVSYQVPAAQRGRGGESITVHNEFHGGVSRSEVMGLVPKIVEASKRGVLEAQRRQRGGF